MSVLAPETPCILSDELIQELGGNIEDLIAPNKKEKRKLSSDPLLPPSEELVQEAKRLSKRSRKLHDQYVRKQEKQLKIGEYIGELQKYKISDVERTLLRSTRECGQTDTLRQKLVKLLRRYKAGLPLTPEELETLFPDGKEDHEGMEILPSDSTEMVDSDSIDVISIQPQSSIALNQVNLPEAMTEDTAAPLAIDLFSMMETSSTSISSTEKKKKSSKSSTASNQPPSQPVALKPSAIGKNLLQQMKNLKSKSAGPSETSSHSVSHSTSSSMHVDTSSSDNNISHHKVSLSQPVSISEMESSIPMESKPVTAPYIPVPIENPIDDYTSTIKRSLLSSQPPSSASSSLKQVTQLTRDPAIQAQRLSLPVCGMEQEIVEAISLNDVVILCGETGSGKSTQVPQFLYEYGYGKHGMIGITQPRRVAAVSTAQRVAAELGQPLTSRDPVGIVGYQIRFDSQIAPDTKIKFMTDGILLREITQDLLLRNYSVIILDEAHERNINTDILLGMISRSIKLRKTQYDEEYDVWSKLSPSCQHEYHEPLPPLKLVIMSATLRVDDFCVPHLFSSSSSSSSPPVLKVEARQYPVITHFSRRTELSDYMKESYRKIKQIHHQLPEGGILVFMTGRKEVLSMCRRLEKTLNKKDVKMIHDDDEHDDKHDDKYDDGLFHGLDHDEVVGDDDDYDDNDYDDIDDEDINNDDMNDDEVVDDNGDIHRKMLNEAINPSSSSSSSMKLKAKILPLYAMMSSSLQQQVFQPPPPGHRLIIIATNVAETSITIPNIIYVVDTGRQKERVIDMGTGISKYEICWISKASAEQRKGRAGRTGPGHVYRLYSSAFYDQHMKLFKEPEILSTPLEDLILQMRCMGIVDMEAFPFPTPPSSLALKTANRLLYNLNAMKKKVISVGGKSVTISTLTELGKMLGRFPINPRYAKMIIQGHEAGILILAIALVSIMIDKSPFLSYDDKSDTALYHHSNSDALARLKCFGAYHYLRSSSLSSSSSKKHHHDNNDDHIISFCETHHLSETILSKSYDLFIQLQKLSYKIFNISSSSSSFLPPNEAQEMLLRKLLVSAFCDHIAMKIPANHAMLQPKPSSSSSSSSSASMIISRRKRFTAYMSCDMNIIDAIYHHPKSSLYHHDPMSIHPEYVLYTHLIHNDKGDTVYMDTTTIVDPIWLTGDDVMMSDCPMIRYSPPLPAPSPYYDMKQDIMICYVIPSYGYYDWSFPVMTRSYHTCLSSSSSSSSSSGWELFYRWFIRFLLEGKIIYELHHILSSSSLKESSSILTNMQASIKISSIIMKIRDDHIYNRSSLLSMMKKMRDDEAGCYYLMEEIQVFIHVDKRKSFRKEWMAYIKAL